VSALRCREQSTRHTNAWDAKSFGRLIFAKNNRVLQNWQDIDSTSGVHYYNGRIINRSSLSVTIVNTLGVLFRFKLTETERLIDLLFFELPFNWRYFCGVTTRQIIALTSSPALAFYSLVSGRLTKRIHLPANITVKQLDWSIYGEQFIITGVRNVASGPSHVRNMVLYVVSCEPMRLQFCLEITPEIFGDQIRNISVVSHMLCVMQNPSRMRFYALDSIRDLVADEYCDVDLPFDDQLVHLPSCHRLERAPNVLCEFTARGFFAHLAPGCYNWYKVSWAVLPASPSQEMGLRLGYDIRDLADSTIVVDQCSYALKNPSQYIQQSPVALLDDNSGRLIVMENSNSVRILRIDDSNPNVRPFLREVLYLPPSFFFTPDAATQPVRTRSGRLVKPVFAASHVDRTQVVSSVSLERDLDLFMIVIAECAGLGCRGTVSVVLVDAVTGDEFNRLTLPTSWSEAEDNIFAIENDTLVHITRCVVAGQSRGKPPHSCHVYRMVPPERCTRKGRAVL
jgi:hypothetical protein